MTDKHTPGEWHIEYRSGCYKICDEQGVTIADIPIQPLDPPEWAEANGYLLADAPALLAMLETAFDILERIADVLLYEDGVPVTALGAREIETIYADAISELAPIETLIRKARGQS
jgi:hypothetical protein